jgi:hypothetical protein
MANLLALFRRRFTLLAIPSELLAPPIIGIPWLCHFFLFYWEIHAQFPTINPCSIPAITNFGNSGNSLSPPLCPSTSIPKDLAWVTPEKPRSIRPKSRRIVLKSGLFYGFSTVLKHPGFDPAKN